MASVKEMKIYCSHPDVQPYGPGGFLACGLCSRDWYAQDPAPLVVLGVTSMAEVDRYPFTLLEGKWKKI